MENDHSFRYSRETWQSEIMHTATAYVIAILLLILLLISSLSLIPFIFIEQFRGIYTVYYQMSWTHFVIFLLLEGTPPTLCSQSPFTLWENPRKHYMFFNSPCHSFWHCFLGGYDALLIHVKPVILCVVYYFYSSLLEK